MRLKVKSWSYFFLPSIDVVILIFVGIMDIVQVFFIVCVWYVWFEWILESIVEWWEGDGNDSMIYFRLKGEYWFENEANEII